MRYLAVGLVFLALPALGELNLREISQEIAQTHLTLQVGFDYSLFGLALVNEARQPSLLIGTNIIGVTLRLTLNLPQAWEIQAIAQQILQESPSVADSPFKLKKAITNRLLSSRVLFFVEGGMMLIPWEYYILPLPFIGFGFYIPLGTTQCYLVPHFNLPLIGGIGLIYVF